MHEYGIALDIYKIACDTVLPYRPGRLESVTVAVGELSAVEPDLLKFAWECLVADGPDSGAGFKVEWHPARQVCPRCVAPKPRNPGDWLSLCPDCGELLDIEGGKELDVLQVSFDEEDEP